MKQFNGFKSEAAGGSKFGPLPAGPYVAKIIAVKVDGVEPDQTLILRMEVAEGPHAGYFRKRYDAEKESSRFEPKYKGDFRLRIPNEDNRNAMYPESDLRRFNDAIFRIEHSNPGYHWDWNEHGLVGKIVGINMQGDEYNGNHFTKIGRLETADDVRNGIVSTMKPRERKGDAYEPPVAQQMTYTTVEDPDLPF